MKKLRKEVKIILAMVLTSTISTASLHTYNMRLEQKINHIQTQIEDLKLENTIVIDTGKTYIDVCSTSSAKSYMDGSKITSPTSEQYAFKQENMHIEDGFYKDDEGNYGVALGTYFGDIGTKYIFVLDTGIELHVVKMEHKADEDVIDGCVHKDDSSVIEIVIDVTYFKDILDVYGHPYSGNFNNNPEFNGSIESIIRIS